MVIGSKLSYYIKNKGGNAMNFSLPAMNPNELLDTLTKEQRFETSALLDYLSEEQALSAWLINHDDTNPFLIKETSPKKMNLNLPQFVDLSGSFNLPYELIDYNDSKGKYSSLDLKNVPDYIVIGEDAPTPTLLDKFQIEFKNYVCGSVKYKDEQKETDELAKMTKTALITMISTAIGTTLGVMGTIIAPAVVLALMVVLKMGQAVYCDNYVDPYKE